MEYSILQKIDHDPALNFLAKHVLKRQNRIISNVKKRGAKKYVKRTTKFGIEFPKMVQ